MATGSLKWFDRKRGFGFIIPDMGPRDVFVHAAALDPSLAPPEPGDRLEFDLVQLRDGRLTALNVRGR